MVSGRTWHDNPYFVGEWMKMLREYIAANPR
jgi:hypothetical protein